MKYINRRGDIVESNYNYRFIATSAFGLEGLISSELKRLGIQNVEPRNGNVLFTGSIYDAFTVNLRSRFADRIMILLKEEKVNTFDLLFRTVEDLPWEKYMNGTEKINVSCKCARSQLMSQRDCQSITKKAIIERLRTYTGRNVFPESGTAFPVHINIHNDIARIAIDTSGEGLSRRGYRTWNGEAPLRETLAAALVEISPWRPGMPLYDPCCGTGTIFLEAALRASHKAPGIHRSFAMEYFSFVNKKNCEEIRSRLREDFDPTRIHSIAGSDIDPDVVTLAEKHIDQAELRGYVNVKTMPLQNVILTEEKGVFICNPPYGERLSDQKSCKILYGELKKLKDRHPGWSLCAITSDPSFERSYGKKADKKRRLYNGTLECNYYIYL